MKSISQERDLLYPSLLWESFGLAQSGQIGGTTQKAQLRATIRKFVVIPYNYRIAEHYGAIIAHRKKNGVPISCADTWIAACARSYDIPLVTHNAKDFTNIPGLQVITKNP